MTPARRLSCWCVRHTPLPIGDLRGSSTTWDLLRHPQSRTYIEALEESGGDDDPNEVEAAYQAARAISYPNLAGLREWLIISRAGDPADSTPTKLATQWAAANWALTAEGNAARAAAATFQQKAKTP